MTADGRSLTGISGDAGSGTQAFTYDNLSRLTGSTGLAVSRSYQYDLDGNRTQKVEGSTTTAYTYDRADQLATQTVTSLPLRTFDYDRYGNLLSAWDATNAQTTYAYDEASRLTTIAPPGGAGTVVTFTIDALDRNSTRSVGGTLADTYGYLDATETAYQVGNATTTGSLLDAEGTRLAVKTGSTVSWLLFDLHGSVAAMCPAGSTTLSDAYRYDGFGQQIANAGSVTNPWRYRGLLNLTSDFGSGALLDMGARDYAPRLGVFTSEDSVLGSAANPMTMNRFLYALANPATLVDPDGHMALAGGGGSGYIAPRPTIGLTTGGDCSQACVDELNNVSGINTHGHVGEPGYTGGRGAFTGYAPWEVDADEEFGNLYADALNGCRGHAFDRDTTDACQFADALWDWRKENEELYCSFHRAECDSRVAHTVLGLAGMVPVLGLAFNGADAVLYISEGDYLGAGIAIGSSVPLAGALGKVAKATRITEGIYQVTSKGLQYVGQSGCIPCRLAQHVATGKITPRAALNAITWEVRGGRTAREIAEQLRINDLNGIGGLANKVNPIGNSSKALLQNFENLAEYLDWLDFHLGMHL